MFVCGLRPGGGELTGYMSILFLHLGLEYVPSTCIPNTSYFSTLLYYQNGGIFLTYLNKKKKICKQEDFLRLSSMEM